ncbi:MAG: hypothetical protein IKN93_01890 [Bacteroidales bacterium]|nr:hypothetical protein [Bacteroidales bacterium]
MAVLFAFSAACMAHAQTTVTREFPVCFRWDNPHYDRTYLDNAAVEQEIFRFIDSLGTANIEQIVVEAFASPEGSLYHNRELCKLRSAEMKWLILKNYPETLGKFKLSPAGESWAMLRSRVAADSKLSDASREKILRILDDSTISLDSRKWRLSKGLGSDPLVGDLWQYLLRAHYRYLRCGVMIIVSSHSAATATVVPSEAKESSETKKPADTTSETLAGKALIDSTLSQSFPPDSLQEECSQVADNQSITRQKPDESKEPCVPLLGVSTNLLYDATYIPRYGFTSIPSVSLEYYPYDGRTTFGADVEWPMWQHWDTHKFMQINNITLWVKRYFKQNVYLYKGPYLFGSVNAVRYGIGFDEKGWIGEGLGGSLGIGFKKYFGSSRFFFDTGLAAGILWSRYDPYIWGNEATGWYYYDYLGKPEDFKERSKRLLWFGPTRLYFSIGYDLLTRKRR